MMFKLFERYPHKTVLDNLASAPVKVKNTKAVCPDKGNFVSYGKRAASRKALDEPFNGFV